MTVRSKANWYMYWYIRRRLQAWPHFIARQLPQKVLYWAVIVAAVRTEQNEYPGSVTAEQMLKKMEAHA